MEDVIEVILWTIGVLILFTIVAAFVNLVAGVVKMLIQ